MLSGRTVADNYPYQLREDIEAGFEEAVRNNQINMAMHYMIEIVAKMQEEIEELKNNQSKPQAKKKATKRKTTETASADE